VFKGLHLHNPIPPLSSAIFTKPGVATYLNDGLVMTVEYWLKDELVNNPVSKRILKTFFMILVLQICKFSKIILIQGSELIP
jgi:hypothetical protein